MDKGWVVNISYIGVSVNNTVFFFKPEAYMPTLFGNIKVRFDDLAQRIDRRTGWNGGMVRQNFLWTYDLRNL